MYYLEILLDCKLEIIEKFGNDSFFRIVLVISVFGMGIDVKFCNSVIIYGFFVNVVDFI